MVGIVLYGYYFHERTRDPKVDFSKYSSLKQTGATLLPSINTLLSLYAALQVMNYSRTVRALSLFIQLISRSLRDMGTFTAFFFFWISVWSALLLTLGARYDKSYLSYAGMEDTVVMFIQTFRNSVGDIKATKYPVWSQILKNATSTNATVKKASIKYKAKAHWMIAGIWLIWFTNILFIFVILMSFLVKTIEQSFNAVMQASQKIELRHQSELNIEARLFGRLFGSRQPLNALIIFSKKEDVTDTQGQAWNGFVQRIKKELDKVHFNVTNVLRQNKDRVKSKIKRNTDLLEERFKAYAQDLSSKLDRSADAQDQKRNILDTKIRKLLRQIGEMQTLLEKMPMSQHALQSENAERWKEKISA